jgi:hypothetical protein
MLFIHKLWLESHRSPQTVHKIADKSTGLSPDLSANSRKEREGALPVLPELRLQGARLADDR